MLSHLEHVSLKVLGFTFDIAETGSDKAHKLKLSLQWKGDADDAGKVFAFATTVAKDRVRISLRHAVASEVMAHGVARIGNVTYTPGPMDKPRTLKIPVEIVTGELAEVQEWFEALIEIAAEHLSVGVWSLQWAEQEIAKNEDRDRDRAAGQGRIEDAEESAA